MSHNDIIELGTGQYTGADVDALIDAIDAAHANYRKMLDVGARWRSDLASKKNADLELMETARWLKERGMLRGSRKLNRLGKLYDAYVNDPPLYAAMISAAELKGWVASHVN